MEYRKKERVTALAVLAGALLVLIYVIPNHIDLDQEFELASLSPAFFPKLATWIIVGLAALLFVMAFTKKKGQDGGEDEEEWLSSREEWSAYRSFLVVIGYLFAMKYIGFLISTVMVLAVLLLLQGEKKPLKVVLTSVLVTAGVYLFFLYVMKVHFPEGLIFK
ncbi:MAG: tripartite tricarboxylate transporter TctB family protein [Desulfatiglandaceae bacterium]